MEAVLTALEGSALATALRESVWLYPLVNAAHIVGIALLFGAIVPLDLRLLGVWSHEPAAVLARVLVPMASIGLLLAIFAGGLLFSSRATEYAASSLFLAKMALVLVGVVNAVVLHRAAAWRRFIREGTAPRVARLRATAVLSLLAWLSALVLGRLVGYF